ncbi:MAG: hypothetical protein KF861_06515, partial [Planctomycetaceae bacterium]|nr:hypothetical protein [Planctomycetaceae bacterium]
TQEATSSFGQARCDIADGAPLLLRVQTTDGVIPQGNAARIVDYSPQEQVYFVEGVGNRD